MRWSARRYYQLRRMRASVRFRLYPLEPRLPLGDTLLGFLFGGMVLDPWSHADRSASPALNSAMLVFDGESKAEDGHEPAAPRCFAKTAEARALRLEQEIRSTSGSSTAWPDLSRGRIGQALAATIAPTIASHKMQLGPMAQPLDIPTWTAGTTIHANLFAARAIPAAFGAVAVEPDSAESRTQSASIYFEQNQGQAAEGMDFVSRAPGMVVGISATELVMALPGDLDSQGARAPDTQRSNASRSGLDASPPAVLRMQIMGGNALAPARGIEPRSAKINYFLGNDPKQWHTNIPTFAKVHYADVYPGIDLVYYGTPEGQLEYDFVVAPGADPDQIGLSFTGADSIALNSEGDLLIHAGDAQIIQPKPVIYQDINNQRQLVEGEFRLETSSCSSTDYCLLSTVYFSLAAYDTSRPLVIDPLVTRPVTLSYSTYLGGPYDDYGFDIAVDSMHNVYVAGYASSGFPLKDPLQGYAGGGDVMVAKLSPDGQSLLYASYLGGSWHEAAYGVAVDGKGGVFLTGYTSSANFPTTDGSFQPRMVYPCTGYDACTEAFVARLSPTGSSLVYSTFLGATGGDSADAIAVDAAGNAYVKGQTEGADFPVLNAVQPVYGGGLCFNGNLYYDCYDAFVTKINPSGTALIYSTYLGGKSDEGFYYGAGGDLAIDAAGHAYVTGYTDSDNFPVFNAFQPTTNANRSAYVAKLSPSGSSFVFSSYLGGQTTPSRAFGIARDSADCVYVSGQAGGADFPVTAGAFQTSYGDNGDGFLSKVKADGTGFVYSTYLGGTSWDASSDVAVDQYGFAHLTGTTNSLNFPTKSPFQSAFGGGYGDAFVTKVAPDGRTLAYSSYLGGTPNGPGGMDAGGDGGGGIAVDGWGSAYVTGNTYSIDFPIANTLQPSNAGKSDWFITKASSNARATASPKSA